MADLTTFVPILGGMAGVAAAVINLITQSKVKKSLENERKYFAEVRNNYAQSNKDAIDALNRLHEVMEGYRKSQEAAYNKAFNLARDLALRNKKD